MDEKVLIFGETCLNKKIFHKRKHLIYIDKVDIGRIVISSKDSYDKEGLFKYFI